MITRSRLLTFLVLLAPSLAVSSLAVSSAFARDTTWKDCELAERAPDRSITACSKLLRAGHAKSGAFHNRGMAYEAKGNLDQAIADISAGIQLDPRRAYRWQERGEIYIKQGNFLQAIDDLNEAIRLDPTRAFRFHVRGNAYRAAGNLTSAIADYSEAIRLDPVKQPFRFSDRGNALRDAGQHERALDDYATAFQLEPSNAWVLVERGRTYVKMGQPQLARRDFDEALAKDPTNAELRTAVERESFNLTSQANPIASATLSFPTSARQGDAAARNQATSGLFQITSIPSSLSDKDEISQRVMGEFYGLYNQDKKCWVSKN